MNNLLKWLAAHEITFKPTDEWSLMFDGNRPDGIYVSAKHVADIRQYNKRNSQFVFEYRGNYETLYCYPIGGN